MLTSCLDQANFSVDQATCKLMIGETTGGTIVKCSTLEKLKAPRALSRKLECYEYGGPKVRRQTQCQRRVKRPPKTASKPSTFWISSIKSPNAPNPTALKSANMRPTQVCSLPWLSSSLEQNMQSENERTGKS